MDCDKRKEQKMKRRLLLTLALLGLLVVAYTPAFAQAPDDSGFDEEGMIADDMGPGPGDGIDEGMMLAGHMGQGRGPEMGQGMGMGMRGRGAGCGKMADELELTKDQRKQLETIRVNFRKEMIPMRAQLQVLNIDLQQLIRSDAKQMEIDAKIDQIGKLRTELQKKNVGHRIAMRTILTPDQREKMDNPPSCPVGKGQGQSTKDDTGDKTKGHGSRGKGL
jgi:Spy/CpxP family protein refolding chaperone